MNVKVDAEFIKSIADAVAKQIISSIKIIIKLPYFKTYVLLSIIFTFIFTLITFPYNELINSEIKSLEGKNFKSIEIGELDFNIIGLSTADSVSIETTSGNNIFIESLVLDDNFNPYSLLISKDFTGSLKLNNFSFKTENVDVSTSINCNYKVSCDEYSIKGINDAQIKMIFENTKMIIEKLTLPSTMGGLPLNIPQMTFTSIISNIKINNGTINIDQLKISGPQLKGSINGSIIPTRGFASSKIDVTIKIDPESSVVEPYKDFLTSYTNADGEIVLPLGGTISRPKIEKKPE